MLLGLNTMQDGPRRKGRLLHAPGVGSDTQEGAKEAGSVSLPPTPGEIYARIGDFPCVAQV